MASLGDYDYDIIVIGAGISGINAGYRIQQMLPDHKYAILEARGGIGGTWDLFKYPGIRSDSDLHTFGFPWQPWTEQKAIADGESIVKYIRATSEQHGITDHIHFHRKVTLADWSSEQQHWHLDVLLNEEKQVRYNARYVIWASGYYDYAEPLSTSISGLENFKGTTIHPQFWPTDLDYADKRIVIIGSGATAVTLLPSLAKTAAHVTMLQRSPGYLVTMPQKDPMEIILRKILPLWLVHKIVRIKWLTVPFLFFTFCRTFPNAARSIMRARTTKALPKNVPHDPHFEPAYTPWQQRLCVCPDGDFFECLHEGKADVATGVIDTMTENTIILKSGQRIDADILVTATGLKVQLIGGSKLAVDGAPVNPGDKFFWKGLLLQDVPNAAFVVGYTNASWTLGADATAQHFCRIIKTMEGRGDTAVVPRLEDETVLEERPLLNLNSTYVKKGSGTLPKAASAAPWRPRSNYFSDIWEAKRGDIVKGLEFSHVST